ncbi:hypothetical protein DICPUDRAFT_87022 [Dictyostelium purpureum]|uniref:protein-serine/threonine phosphatase n=1 Tax=Dictyostelium purpureum TaxID=5786 RepID=F0ZFG0_DICPU|nr:uncharacterized protein DICPUDRAFT_87022 [Dictyostelium purpureum]EGC37331.1 hypothetical protein DICPUDRAFT_87022 [Dictyostelium purpureum]|eukprot:XP_003286145.1 hypothetical protein DICPUDRAFT_87022 [Dictyostelium purpureum]
MTSPSSSDNHNISEELNNEGNQEMSDGEIVDDKTTATAKASNIQENIEDNKKEEKEEIEFRDIEKEQQVLNNSNCIEKNKIETTETSISTAATTTTAVETNLTANYFYIDSETIVNENELIEYSNNNNNNTPSGLVLRNSSNGIVTYNTPIESIPYPSIVGDRLYMPLAYSSDQNRKEELDFEETLRDYKNFKEKKRSRSYSSDRSRSRSRSRSGRRRNYSSSRSRSKSDSRSRSRSSHRYSSSSKKSSSRRRRRSRSSSDSRSRSRSSKRYSSSRYSSRYSRSRYSSRRGSRSRSRSRSYSRSRRDRSRSRSYSRRRSYSTSSSRSRSRSNRKRYSRSKRSRSTSYSDSSRSRSRSNRRSRKSKSRSRSRDKHSSKNKSSTIGIKPNQQTSFVTFLKPDGSWFDSDESSKASTPKMHLIVDIDHTLIHSTKDPNGESYFLKDKTVHKISFPETNETFYVKERPNAIEFLRTLSQQFYIYVYSFHPKYYVERVASILDPHSNIFSKVISKEIIESIENIKICRENNNSQKPFIVFNEQNVPKIFKFESINQLIILDDREDVWRNFQDNLILLDTFKYFNKEVQDFTPIYQYPFSFQELSRAFPFPNITESLNNNNFNSNLNQIIKCSQYQQQQQPTQQPPQPNINFLSSNQPYLDMFSCLLGAMQSEFISREITDPSLHIKSVIQEIRSSVLMDCNIVFSGIFPKQIDPSKLCHTRVSKITESFGASISQEIDSNTTHVIFIKEGTSKVLQALKNPNIKVVHFAWLRDCIHRWERIDELNYSVNSYQNLIKLN